MYLYFNLQKYQADRLLADVSDVKSLLAMQISILEILQIWTGNEKDIVRPYLCIDFNQLHRAFVVNYDAHKVISIAFNFSIKTKTPNFDTPNNAVTEIHYNGKTGLILPRNISEAQTILGYMDFSKGWLYRDIHVDDQDNISPGSFTLLEFLMFHEAGYIRYDNSVQGFNATSHPVNHFDVNYSVPSHFKLGLDRPINLEQFMTLIDLKKQCPLVNLTPPLYERFVTQQKKKVKRKK